MTSIDVMNIKARWDQERQERRVLLQELLKEVLAEPNCVVVETATMAAKSSYLGVKSIEWITEKVELAWDMPQFKYRFTLGEKRNKEGDIVKRGALEFTSESINNLKQRQPDYTREQALVRYLIGNERRKFPPLTVVVTEDWVQDPEHSNWDEEHRALKSSLTTEALDLEDRLRVLRLEGARMYALDGQHRLLGMKALAELKRTRKLVAKDKLGNLRRGQEQTLEDLLAEFNLSEAEFDLLPRETIGIEFLPAVLEGETYEEAQERIRDVFVYVNKSAVKTTPADEAKLSTDGFSRVARDIAFSHPLLKKDQPGDRVNLESTSLPIGSIKITGLVTLVDMVKIYLEKDARFSRWRPFTMGEHPAHPTPQEISDAYELMTGLWNGIQQLPVYQAIRRGESINLLREFPGKKFPEAKGNLLLRPIGQLIIAAVVRDLHLDPRGPKLPLEQVFQKLSEFDRKSGFDAATTSSPFYGVTFEPLKRRMVTGEKDRILAGDLLKYLVAGPDNRDTNHLRERFRSARTFRDSADPSKLRFLNHDGIEVNSVALIQLPPTI